MGLFLRHSKKAGRPRRCTTLMPATHLLRRTKRKAFILLTNLYKDAPVPTADFIITTNAFQHTLDAEKFVEGIAAKLDGTWILEFPYTLRTLRHCSSTSSITNIITTG